MTILQKPDEFSLASGMKDIIISSQGSVTFTFAISSGTAFTEKYYPDADKKIYIRELGKLCQSYIPMDTLRYRFLMSLFADDGTGGGGIVDATVQYCNVELDVAATEFLEKHFLSLLVNEKIIYREQKEYLSLVVSSQTTVKAIIRRKSGVFESLDLLTVSDLEKVLTIDVSPSKFSNPETISYYTIIAGERVMTYYVRPEPMPGVQFIFLNSFGVKETYIPSGIINRENKYENSFGVFSGKYRKHFVDLEKQYTARTGILDDNHATWLEDLFLSKDVFLLTSSGVEKEVTIEEATVKRSSAREELPAYEFKYRLAKVNQNEFETKRSRIFDNTFDYTFN